MHLLLAFVAGIVICQVAILVTTVYLHRALAHKAITVRPGIAVFLRVIIWVTTGIRPRDWAAVHRRHHAACDTEKDPHSPAILGFWKVQLFNAYLYQRATRDREANRRYSLDLERDRLDRWLLDRDWLGPMLGIGAMTAVFGWQFALIAAVVHMTLYVALNGAINAVGHTLGARPHENSATNGRFLALLTVGEGLHNNHHDQPTSARFSRRWLEIDFGYWFIKMLSSVRLATIRRPVLRPALVPVGSSAARGRSAR